MCEQRGRVLREGVYHSAAHRMRRVRQGLAVVDVSSLITTKHGKSCSFQISLFFFADRHT